MTGPTVVRIAPGAGGGRRACGQCGTELAATLLSCPSCHALVHADQLKSLAAEAEAAEQAGNIPVALAKWREAMELLPPDSEQYATITARTSELARRVEPGKASASATPDTRHPLKRAWAGIVSAALIVLSKAKLLLLGLTKLGTLSSMLVFFGLYWGLWGWRFALGFVICIYIHEMGHVAALTRYGISAGAPMFIPGLGALVRLKQYPTDARQDARVGLAGPIWGLGAGLAAYGVFLATHAPIWAAIARTAGYLNLFNLLPVWQLDGNRGFRSLARVERWAVVATMVVAWGATSQGLLLLLAAAAVFRAFGKDAPAERDPATLATFAGLIAVLSWLSMVAVPGSVRTM